MTVCIPGFVGSIYQINNSNTFMTVFTVNSLFLCIKPQCMFINDIEVWSLQHPSNVTITIMLQGSVTMHWVLTYVALTDPHQQTNNAGSSQTLGFTDTNQYNPPLAAYLHLIHWNSTFKFSSQHVVDSYLIQLLSFSNKNLKSFANNLHASKNTMKEC